MNPPVDLPDLARRWRWRILARDGLRAFGAVGLAVTLTLPWTRSTPWEWWLVLGAAASLILLRASRLWRVGPELVAAQLDRAHPELEESSGLFLRSPGSLSVPERLQRQRLETAWADLRTRGGGHGAPGRQAPAGFWRGSVALFAVALAAWTGGTLWRAAHPRPVVIRAPESSAVVAVAATTTMTPAAPTRPRLAWAELTVQPPGYTGRPPRIVRGLDAEVEEGAAVSWRLRFGGDGPPLRGVRLAFGEGESARVTAVTLREAADGSGWEGSGPGAAASIYRVVVTLSDGSERELPEFGSLTILPDRPPAVTVLRPTQPRTELDPAVTAPDGRPLTLAVEVRVNDDHGIGDARLVATVAKGSGEAVKFRERVLALDPVPGNDDAGLTHARERRFAAVLDLAALGMEPGDELYFHVEAEDNRPPVPQPARSETRFVVLRGPASAPLSTSGRGLTGVNLVPEYFRSQRQLILDTERLLADRPGLTEREFRRRSADLGADQALLRLRYGQFVGEEHAPAGIGGGADHEELALNPLRPGVPTTTAGGGAVNDPRAGLRTAMRLRLQHADQARGRGDAGHADAAPTAPDMGRPPTAEQVLSTFVHRHDVPDAPTLFDPGTKTTLRGVLAEMWAAEGLLRTTRPEEALEPERRALAMLKELQQGERLYVQRVGFESPPLREAERRGRGDVGTVPERAGFARVADVGEEDATRRLAAVRTTLAELPGGDGTLPRMAEPQRMTAREAAGALAAAVARRESGEDKGVFLAGLRALRRWEDAAVEPGDGAALRSALLRLLPPAEERPGRPVEPAPGLGRAGAAAASGEGSTP